MTPAPPPRRTRLTAAALFVLAAAGYAPTVRYDFVNYDDHDYVYRNPRVLGGLTGANVRWAAGASVIANWHPVTMWSLQVDATLWGANPAGYHLTNLLLHAANTALFFLVLVRATGSPGRSAAAAALWAVHPLHAESVAWVSERKDLLCGLFWLLTMRVYLWHAAAPSRRRMLAVAGVFALALASKPMAVTLPFALLLFDAWPLGRFRTRADLLPLASEKAYLFLLAAAGSLMAYYYQSVALATQASAGFDPRRLGGVAVAYAVYLRKTVWPTDLTAFYEPLPYDLPAGEILAAAALLAGVTAAGGWLWRAAPYLLVGWLWFLGTLVPVIGLVQVGDQPYSDRYTYLPHLGLFAAAVWGAADLAGRGRVRAKAAAVVALVAVGFALTWQQAASWRDSRALWEQAVAVNPASSTAWARLAGYYYNAEQDWAEAARCGAEAVRLDPLNATAAAIHAAAVRKLEAPGRK